MTPAEHARLIDKQEFEAECRAVRQRAYARIAALRPKPHKPETRSREPRKLTYLGESLTIREWSERLGISINTIHGRIHYGWTDERVLSTPIQKSGQHFRKDRQQ